MSRTANLPMTTDPCTDMAATEIGGRRPFTVPEPARPAAAPMLALPGGRTPELDGIRGVAILLVLSWHYVVGRLPIPASNWQVMGLRILGVGWSGVDLFFVLSGFLIGGILLDNRGSPNVFKVFYIRRALRIVPIYAVLLGVAYYCLNYTNWRNGYGWGLGGHRGFLPYLTMTQNFIPSHSRFLGPTWSLAIEEQFYLILPALVVFLSSRALVTVSWTVVLLSTVVRFAVQSNAGIGRFDGLFIGVLIAVGARNPAIIAWVKGHIGAVKWAACPLLLGALGITVNPGPFGSTLYLWLALLFGSFLIIALADHDGWVARLMRTRWLTWTGQIAYGLYLFHQPIYIFVHGSVLGGAPNCSIPSHLALTGLAFAAVMIVASLSYQYFELPLMNFGKSFRYAAPAGDQR